MLIILSRWCLPETNHFQMMELSRYSHHGELDWSIDAHIENDV